MEERQIRPTVVNQALWLGLVAALVVLAASARGSDGGGGSGGSAEEQREEAKARALPEGGPLRPGLYTTKKFEPSLRALTSSAMAGRSRYRRPPTS